MSQNTTETTASTSGIRVIGVLGLGTMGAGIAHLMTQAGLTVIGLESDAAVSDGAVRAIATRLASSVKRGTITSDDAEATLARLTTTTDVKDLAGVDAVIEAVTEDRDIKIALLQQVAAVVGPTTPLLTNTSALSVTEIAAALPEPGRVAGLHFFNPAPVMRTIEIVRALTSDDELIGRLHAFVDELPDKVGVVVKDRPGFLLNSLLIPYLNDVIAEYDAELATAEDLDVALKLGLGYKSGPLEMLDMIGLDVHLAATRAAYDATLDDRYAPPPLLQQMVAAGRLGTKNGRGFRTDRSTTND